MKPIFELSKLEFDPDEHAYTYNGLPVVSVTQALAMTGFVDTTHFNDHARQRGTYVHEATVLIDEGTLDWAGLSAELRGYCDSWTAFLKDTDFKVLHSEMPVAHPAYMYAGTLDRIGEINGALAVIDIKTGASQAYHGLQLSGYAATFEDPLERYSLHLGNNGNYKLVQHKGKTDLRVFLSAVTCSNWQRRAK